MKSPYWYAACHGEIIRTGNKTVEFPGNIASGSSSHLTFILVIIANTLN